MARHCVTLLLMLVAFGTGACRPSVAVDTIPTATLALDNSGIVQPLEQLAAYATEVALTGLSGPTQMINGPDGRLWAAQLNGAENAGTGQIVAVDWVSGQQEVLLDGLSKPTGLAVLNQTLWIVAGPDILRAALDSKFKPQEVETVLADLPNNGRSNGTLTVTPEGMLLYETSGRRAGNSAMVGSATLWMLDPNNPHDPVALAAGLKGAYAHAYDSAGHLWTTEISDDLVNGQAPPDEINLVQRGSNYGWPSCMGMGEPAEAFGGTADLCATTVRPIALLPIHATPTGIIESPWEPAVLLVTQFVSGEVVRIDPSAASTDNPAPLTVILSGVGQPQDLLVASDGAVLLSDHASGTVYRIVESAP